MLDAIGIQRRVRPANLLRIGQALEEHVLPVRQLESARLHSHAPSPGQQFSADATLEDKENIVSTARSLRRRRPSWVLGGSAGSSDSTPTHNSSLEKEHSADGDCQARMIEREGIALDLRAVCLAEGDSPAIRCGYEENATNHDRS